MTTMVLCEREHVRGPAGLTHAVISTAALSGCKSTSLHKSASSSLLLREPPGASARSQWCIPRMALAGSWYEIYYPSFWSYPLSRYQSLAWQIHGLQAGLCKPSEELFGIARLLIGSKPTTAHCQMPLDAQNPRERAKFRTSLTLYRPTRNTRMPFLQSTSPVRQLRYPRSLC